MWSIVVTKVTNSKNLTNQDERLIYNQTGRIDPFFYMQKDTVLSLCQKVGNQKRMKEVEESDSNSSESGPGLDS